MSNPQHEPTMEEILASIRKIISEDSTEEQPAAEAQPAQQPVEAVQAEAEPVQEPEADDVLELTEELPEEPVPAPEPSADEIVFQTIEEEIVTEPEPAMVQREDEPEPAAAAPSDIFSDKTRRALDDAFANIEPEEDETPAPVSVAASLPGAKGRDVESVFEGAVREAFDPVLREWLGDQTDAIIDRMKPVIRQWMDEHFPPMLEEAVRNEVARVAKTRRR